MRHEILKKKQILFKDNSAPLEPISHSKRFGPFLALPLNFPARLLFQPEDGGSRFFQGDRVSARQHGRWQSDQITLHLSEKYKIRISLNQICKLLNVCYTHTHHTDTNTHTTHHTHHTHAPHTHHTHAPHTHHTHAPHTPHTHTTHTHTTRTHHTTHTHTHTPHTHHTHHTHTTQARTRTRKLASIFVSIFSYISLISTNLFRSL
jgi:hypothetical protein